MKFQLAVNLERIDDQLDMQQVMRHTLEMVQMAERGGFHIVWSAEHHALEMTIAPDPFQLLTWWAQHTDTIRLGTAVAVAAYWHPIKLAGTAAMTDLLSGGRLEFGIGSGAYQREFDRMQPGLKQSDGWRYMNEMLPVLKNLWQGDYEHNGEFWQFPVSTSVPKPVQTPHPEAELYKQRLDDAMAKFPGMPKPIFAMMRHTAVYDKPSDVDVPIKAIQRTLGQFENLFRNLGDVHNGFPREIPLNELEGREQYDPKMLQENLMFGTPDECIKKLKRYEALGVDQFTYYASMGLGHKEQKRSLELFINEVMPEFAE